MKKQRNSLGLNDYENIMNAIYCSILIIDEHCHIMYANASAQKLARESHIDYTGFLAKLSQHVNVIQGQGRFTIALGNSWIICNIYPWLDEKKRKGSILVLHESGHEFCASQELDISKNTLKEIEAIIESVADGVIVADSEGIIIRVNEAVEKTFHVEKTTLIGKPAAEIVKNGIFKEGIVEKVLTTKKAVVVASDYQEKQLIYTGIPNFNELHVMTSVIVTIQDVSTINQLQRKLEHQKIAMDDYVREIAKMKSVDVTDTDIIAQSKKMSRIIGIAKVVSQVDSIVLITGESGTGKEKVVDVIYHNSNRKDKPLIKINCGAIPDSLFESELFGYEHGSFTGARKNGKIGFFELANTGTLLLDEVGELSLSSQVKLLRVIQEKEVMRIGGSKTIPIDVRIIAATNRDLWLMVQEGNFRQDLYYRLNVINIEVPPLRERRDDIIPLARYFVTSFNKKHKKHKQLSLELCHTLWNMDWPGNIRELENVIETMVVLVPGNLLLPEHLPIKNDETKQSARIVLHGIIPLKDAIEEVERQLLLHAGAKYKTTREIAAALGVNQSTISRKLQQFHKKHQ
jgi:transcriptional regulator with PAS, ATPase and Fis domain